MPFQLIVPCAGGGRGRPRPLHSRRWACAPSNPKMMQSHNQPWVRMLPLCSGQDRIHLRLDRTKACADAINMCWTSVAGGSGACHAPDGEREGRSLLAAASAALRSPAQFLNAVQSAHHAAVLQPLDHLLQFADMLILFFNHLVEMVHTLDQLR